MTQQPSPSRVDFAEVYNDTSYFINAIVSDYDFYKYFIDAVKGGGAEFEVKRKNLKKNIDEKWISIIEDGIIYLDNAIRKPIINIDEREEVLPIELSRNITSRSLRHLAQHTDYINSVDSEGNITPNKILNVFHEETMLTYENKFINTLIRQLYIFVNKRYMQLKDGGDSEDCVSMDFSSEFSMGGSRGKISLAIEVADKNDVVAGNISMSDRLSRLNSAATNYINSDFARQMGQNYVHPPIIRTNAIMKNKDLFQCLQLWQFIESYSKVGYELDVQESSEKPDSEYISDLYSTLALQYMMFRYRMADNGGGELLEENRTHSPISPVFKSELQDINTDSYNIYNTEYRQVLSVVVPGSRRLTQGELKIRSAIDTALAADKLRASRLRAAQRLKNKNSGKKARSAKKQNVTSEDSPI